MFPPKEEKKAVFEFPTKSFYICSVKTNNNNLKTSRCKGESHIIMKENTEKKSLDQVEEPNLEPVAKYGFVDESGNVVIPFVWHNAKYFYEGLAAVSDGVNGYGYIDKTGKLVIPCQWFAAYDFSEGMAVVLDTDGGKYGFIDKKGDLVIPCQWDDAYDFCEGLARVQDNNGKYGFIDQTGKLVIPCQWNSARDFDNGEAHVRNGDGWAYIDKTGKVVRKD